MSDLPPPPEPTSYTYVAHEHRPIEILVFRVDPADVAEFLRVDHEVWTLGEAATPGLDGIPFVSKEVWLDDDRPGEITIVFVWPDRTSWDLVGEPSFQQRLTTAFEQRFPGRHELVRAVHEESRPYRWSRFERT